MHYLFFWLLALLPFWQDVAVTSVNADTRRTEVVYYPTREDALHKGFRESPNYVSLNGVWDFKYYEDWHQVPGMGKDGTPEAVFPASWDSIRVPGNWEVQGWGIPIYVNIPYDFAPVNPQPPHLPDVFPASLYHRTFSVPQDWNGRRVFLNLCGTKSGTYVFVNGEPVGYSEDSKDLARYDITPYLKPGDNDLMFTIFRYSTGSYLECQDFWRISGIERDVYLSSEAEGSRFDFSVVSSLAEDLSTGIFRLRMRSEAPVEVSYELLDQGGNVVSGGSFGFEGDILTPDEHIPSVRQWSAETPELYTLLLNVDGEYTRFHVGFRRLEIKPVSVGDKTVKVFFVNGRPIKFKGVNLHEHNPWTGHYVTREDILRDLKLMREANINAIRTCHYPQSREFYELCDSLGFYVCDEANIESHGMSYDPERTLAGKPEWYPKHLDRTLNMYRRTANYPCVTVLSLGNEAGNGVNFESTYRELKALEEGGQNRPVVYEQFRPQAYWLSDFETMMYPGTDWFRNMGENHELRPVVPCEYAHAMGNSTGSLDWQWEQIYSHVQLQGGYIWDWVDQGLYDEARGWTYGGDYGENAPSDANFNCNGLVNPDRLPHPGLTEVRHVYQNVSITPVDAQKGVFRVLNRHYFTTLENYVVSWWVERDGRKPWYWKKHTLRFTTAPQVAEEFTLRLPGMNKAGEYRIFFEVTAAKDGLLIDRGELLSMDEVLVKASSVPEKVRAKGSLDFADEDSRIVVSGHGVELVFDKAEGAVTSWKVKGKDVIDPSFGLRPNFWRAPNDNDYGNYAPRRAARFKTPGGVQAVEASKVGENVVILAKGEDVRAEERYTVFPDGTLKIEVRTSPADLPEPQNEWYRVEIPRLGFRFRVADDVFTYFGRGPIENYQDRNSGTFKSIWTASASGNYFPYVRPQETGHRTETSWLQVGGLTVLSGEPFEFSALRMPIETLDGGLEKSQTHLSDVHESDFTEVCIDYRMTGVGGYDSWGARPEKARTLWADTAYSYDFTLVPRKTTSKITY